MAVTHEDIEELRKVFDREYVRIVDCNDIQERNTKKFASDDKRIGEILIEQKYMRAETKSGLKFNNWLTTAILGLLVSGIIGYIFYNFA